MSAHQLQTRHPAGLHLLAGARFAAGTQLAIVGAYLAGAVVPALADGLLPLGGADTTPLWPTTAGTGADLLHVLAFFAASVGLVVSSLCVPVCLAVLVTHWRRLGVAARVLLTSATALGVVFVAFSATPYGYVLRDLLAS